ncbi:hypothetical protein CC78DRAFT_536292 [Lojkania enalia]|uniref:Uncharacterized protein n=1 Tax=Lojkania enalia TaxID=147567 RepID=A0A9P4K3I7_9PLEO|nr:hypothetical protein CC78DRAFT_536292 [Didymosphaeria enalia]
MSLSSENGMDANDFTIPFPVLLTPQSPHHRFDPDYPSGTPDPSIPDDPVITTAFSYLQDARPQTSNGFDKRMIPGIVIGVAAGAALIAVGCWLLWRRRGLKKKRVASPVEDGNVRTVRRVGNQDIELTHRPVEDGEDAPPAYHEVVREQRERR